MSHPSATPAAGSQQQPPSPSYPSMQELRHAQSTIQELPGKLGLIWPLTGPLDSAAILIKQGPAAPEPYYNVTTGQYHTLATSSLTEPKISSITVRASELELWENNWLERHAQHSDPDADDNGPDVEWRAFPDWDPDVDEGEIKRRWPMISCLSKTHRLRSWKHMGSALSREHIQFRLDCQIVESIRIDTELHFRVKWLIVQCSQGRLELSSQTHKPWMHSWKVIMNRDISRPIPRRSNNQARLLKSGARFTTTLHELHPAMLSLAGISPAFAMDIRGR